MDVKTALLSGLVALQFLGVTQVTCGSIEDPEEIEAAYENVRSDSNPATWTTFGYEGKQIVYLGSGDKYEDFLNTLKDDNRIYAYVRFETGDEMSRRAKFAFIIWIGPRVSPLKKAAVSTDKAFVKNIVTKFGKEILADEKKDVKYETVKRILEKASGAAYGTGQ